MRLALLRRAEVQRRSRRARLTADQHAEDIRSASALDAKADTLLDEVDKQLASDRRLNFSELHLKEVHNLRDEFVTEHTEDACYVLPQGEEASRMYFICTDQPENDNLQCEQQGEGMDWVCSADIGI